MKRKYVVGFMFSADKKKVALIKKETPEWQKGKLNGIGGKIESNEDHFQAILREFKEETGVSTNIEDWNYYLLAYNDDYELHGFCTFSDKIFDCKTIEKEEIIIVDLDLNQLKDKVINNVIWMLEMALDDSVAFSSVKTN